MPKYLVFIIVNLAILLLFYICGTLISANYNIFEWYEGTRIAIGVCYPFLCVFMNVLIMTEYETPVKL